MPRISFIIPVYNVEKYIRQCVNSILRQDYKDFEIILVDDGSIDNSGLICDNLEKHNKVVRVIHQENRGLSEARNTGIIHATGEYVLFVDGDDFIGKNSLSEIIKVLNKYPSSDVMFLESLKYYPNKKTVSFGEGLSVTGINGKEKKDVLQHLSCLPKFPGSACTKLVRRSMIINNNLYFEKDLLSEDIRWTVLLLQTANHYSYCDKNYYYYRQNRIGSITNKTSLKQMQDLLNTVAMFVNKDTSKDYQSIINSFMAYEYMNVLWGYSRLGRNKRKIKDRVKAYSWILVYSKDKRACIINYFLKILGLNATSLTLNIAYKIKCRIR